MLRILLFVISVFLLPTLEAKDKGMVVRLPTQTSLAPLYLSSFSTDHSGFDSTYVKALEKVLQFDLHHNGRTQLVPHTKKREAQAIKEPFGAPFNTLAWRDLNLPFIVRIHLANKKLSAETFSTDDAVTKNIQGIPLSGDLATDRQRIHQLADSIHHAFFGEPGIAATKVIYVAKIRNGRSDSYKWISEVWESDYDGGNAHQLTHDGNYCVTPAYLPPKPGHSCGSFFYVSYRLGQPKIYVASIRDGVGRRFSFLRGNQLMPSIAPQRDKIAFISDAGGNPDLFLQAYNPQVGVLGKPRQIYTAFRGAQASPSFSPNGDRVAFVSNKDGSPRVYVMEIPFSGAKSSDIQPTLISKENRENTSPTWSPDGEMLAYSSKTNGTRQIWVYDFRTGKEKQLTYGEGVNKENPTWAPNSLHLMYNAGDENQSELYLINLNQLDAIKITSGAGEKRFPNWEPRINA